MCERYLNFTCTMDTFCGKFDDSVVSFNAYENYELITEFYDSCPECESFSKEEYFDGDWYDNWEDFVIWDNGKIAARAGIWKNNERKWEVAGVITHPNYRGKGYSVKVVSYCISKILAQGKTAILSTAETNAAMIAVAGKVGFVQET